MADTREAERLRRLAILVAAEREIATETRRQYAVLLAAINNDVLNDKAIIAAIRDPNRGRNQANALWAKLTGSILGKITGLFASRFKGTGAPKVGFEAAKSKFQTKVASRLAGVPNEVYADLNRIVDDGVRAGLSEAAIEDQLRAELTPGHAEYEARLEAVASRVARTTAIAAFNAGDQEGFLAISEHDGVPMATKSWLSSHDTKVRETHRIADEDPANHDIPADAEFTVGGFPGMYPGAPELPAHEAANCRCTAIYRESGSLVASTMTQGAAVTTPETALPSGFRGPIAALDVPTGDRRQLCTPSSGIKTREYPLTLTKNHVGDPTGYPVIGHLDRVWAQDGLLYGEGSFDLGGEDGREAARHLAEGHCNTVSIDPDMVTAAVNTYDAEGNLTDSQQLSAEQAEQFRLAGTPFANTEDTTQLLAFTDWRLAGLAMVPIPAYTQARIEPVYDYAPSDPCDTDAIVSSVGGQVFNAKFFGDPQFTEYTPPTIDEDGHFYGHVREHGTCYQYGGGAGDGGFCLEPPDSACGYAKFEQHGAKLDDGRTIRVGAITFGDGHYSAGSLLASREHYNDVATIAAKVNAGTDAFGVWVNGQVLDEYADKAYDLLLSPLSGHWEPDADNRGHLEMIAAHIVVTPGYRTRRIVAGFDDAGKPNSLIITTFPAVDTTPVASTAPSMSSRSALVAAMNELRRANNLQERIQAGTERAIIAAASSGARIAPTSTPWNGPAAAASILSNATKDGKIDVGMASQGFLAHVGDGSKRGDWKLPFARISGGSVQVVPRGVAAAAGRLNQTDGIDKGSAASKIKGLYSRIHKMDPSWPAAPPE